MSLAGKKKCKFSEKQCGLTAETAAFCLLCNAHVSPLFVCMCVALTVVEFLSKNI